MLYIISAGNSHILNLLCEQLENTAGPHEMPSKILFVFTQKYSIDTYLRMFILQSLYKIHILMNKRELKITQALINIPMKINV